MSFLGKAKKADLVVLATELGETIPIDAKIIDLKEIIVQSKHYDESFVKELLANIMSDRIEQAELQTRESEKQAREHELKMRELELKSIEATNRTNVNTLNSGEGHDRMGNSFLAYLNMMKGVILDPPQKSEEWPFFFHHAERMFKLYEVPEQYRGKITLHCLKGYAKGLNAMLSDEDFDNYPKIKEFVLKEHRITPLQHKKNFDTCFKSHSESYAQYAARVEAALELYLTSREVETFEKLKELIVTDKIKETLSSQAKSYVFLKETEKWLPVSQLVREIDNFLVSVPKNTINASQNVRRFSHFHQESKANDFVKTKVPIQSDFRPRRNSNERREQFIPNKQIEQYSSMVANKKIMKCFKCHEEGHVKKFCPKVNAVSSRVSNSPDENVLASKGLNEVCIKMSNASFDWEIPVGEIDGELLRIDLEIGCHRFQGIIDSGAEITVLRKSVVPEEYLQSSGKIFLRPAVGLPVEAKLISVPLNLWTKGEDIKPYVQVHAAVVEGLHEEALITPKVFKLLEEQKRKYLGEDIDHLSVKKPSEKIVLSLGGRGVGNETEVNKEPNDLENSEVDVTTTPVESNVSTQQMNEVEDSEDKSPPTSQAQRFRKEQLACPTLQSCFKDAKQRKNNYWIESELLYHTNKVGGQKYIQLVVPECRRKEILRLAHEIPYGGHLAAKKTKDRVTMSFWWEGLPKDVVKLCESCQDCQLRRNIKIKDRVPIEAVGRPELPFQVVNADILGPIEPKSSRGHQYVLCVVDQHSRWPEAVPIKSLTAKATCDAFLEIFMRTGIPRIIAMDNGTNFAAKLTQEFLKRLGTVPKFSTPGYPQSNGLVERWVGTMKSMLHHAINSQGRGWDKELPFLLWAYREVPNATTGVSPFLLVHGRPPVGPLSILKQSWENEVMLPHGIGESIPDYLVELRKRLESAAKYADDVTKRQQGKYVHYYNLRSINTEFSVGDEVVVLIPDSTNKLCSKWRGPGEIVERKSQHSYNVKLPDGSVRHYHQNKLRKYIQPSNTMGVIYEADEDFGEIQHAPIEFRETLNEQLKYLEETDKWKILSGKQKSELFKIINQYFTLFNGELKRAKAGIHSIKLKSGIERKQPHIYKIPESLKPQVKN